MYPMFLKNTNSLAQKCDFVLYSDDIPPFQNSRHVRAGERYVLQAAIFALHSAPCRVLRPGSPLRTLRSWLSSLSALRFQRRSSAQRTPHHALRAAISTLCYSHHALHGAPSGGTVYTSKHLTSAGKNVLKIHFCV